MKDILSGYINARAFSAACGNIDKRCHRMWRVCFVYRRKRGKGYSDFWRKRMGVLFPKSDDISGDLFSGDRFLKMEDIHFGERVFIIGVHDEEYRTISN